MVILGEEDTTRRVTLPWRVSANQNFGIRRCRRYLVRTGRWHSVQGRGLDGSGYSIIVYGKYINPLGGRSYY